MSLRAEILRLGTRCLLKGKPGPEASFEERRHRAAAAERWVPNPPSSIKRIAVDAGGVEAEWVVTPASQHRRYVLYLHGGGYVVGSPSLYRHLTWRLARAVGARLLAADYRLAPEHPFPAALDDAMAVYAWLLASGADPRQIAVIGNSAGGGLALRLGVAMPRRRPIAAARRSRGLITLDRSGIDRSLPSAERGCRPFFGCQRHCADRRMLSRRRRPASPLRLAALRRSARPAACLDPGWQRRGAARRRHAHGGLHASRWMRGRARSLAADAACMASVRLGNAGGAARDNAYRPLCRGADDGHDGFAAIRRPPVIIPVSDGRCRKPAVVVQLNKSVPVKTMPALTMPGILTGNSAYCSQTTNR